MPEIDLGQVRGGAPDYAVNDQDDPRYITNRPCYFTGNVIEQTIASNVPITIGDVGLYTGGVMESGEKYRLTINGVSVELTAATETIEGMTGVLIGDSMEEFMEGMEGSGSYVPTYGYIFGMIVQENVAAAAIIPTDGTGAMMMSTFGLTMEDLSSGSIPVTLTHLALEAVKLDKRLLPDGIGGGGKAENIHVVEASNIGDLELFNFAEGDVILMVGNTEVSL